MYEIFEQLLTQAGVTSYQVSKATGIATATLSDWKRGRSTPKQDKLQKIADYFHVPLSYLLSGNMQETSWDTDMLCLVQSAAGRESVKTLLEYSIRAEDSDIRLAIAVLKALEEKGKQ